MCSSDLVFLAKEGRPGPVWIDIPLDVQAAMLDVESLENYVPVKRADDENVSLDKELSQVADMLKEAKRPVIIAGQGIERGNGREIFRSFVDYLQIPTLTSWLAAELLPYDHPCNLGKPGMVAARYSNFAMQNADLVLAVGTRLDPAMIGYNPEDFAPEARKIIVDIDAAELNKFEFPVDLKIQTDAACFIKKLFDSLASEKVKTDCQAWLDRSEEHTSELQSHAY